MTYDPDGRLATVTDPHGFTESYAYEPTGELKKTTDKLLRDTTWTHDQLGRVTAMLDTLGRTHASAYPLPNAGTWQGPSLLAGSADASSPTASLTTPLRSGDYQIGHNGLPTEGYPAAVPLYRDATFELSFSRVFDTGKRMTQRFDRVGQPIATTTFSTGGGFWVTQDSWSTATAAPVRTAIASGPQTGRFFQNEFFENVAEDGFGGPPNAIESYTRDDAGRATLLTRRLFGSTATGGQAIVNATSSYTYRSDGRLGRLVNPDGDHTFTYDSRGLLATQTVAGEGTYTHGYDEMGRSSALQYPDGHTRTQQYDELGRVISRCYDYGLGTVRCYGAQYDAVGNPVRMTDPDGVDVLEYDALDRLKKVTRFALDGVSVQGVEEYAYNGLGALSVNAGVALNTQRPRLDGAGLADAAVPATTPDGQTVTLNAGGFVTSLHGTSFTFGKRGTFEKATPPIPAASESYAHDVEMRRVARTLGIGPSELYYFEGLDRVAVFTAVGTIQETYLFDGIDHPLRMKRGTTTAYYEVDLAGNVRGLRASGGSDLGGYRYTAFGKTVEDTTTFEQPLRWKGRWFSDVAGGIYDVRARQWSPELGAFLAVDEFRYFSLRRTLWGWPAQSPVKYRDPSGRFDPGSFGASVSVATGGTAFAPLGLGLGLGLGALWWALHPTEPAKPGPGTGPGAGSGGGLGPGAGPAPGPGPGGGSGGSGGGPGGPYRTPGDPGGPQYPECAGLPGFTATEKCCRGATGFRDSSGDDCPNPNDPSKLNFEDCMSENGF